MAYEGPEYWNVIYRAVGDFSGLMKDAAQARAALQGMADATKAESAAEVAGATQAAAARQKDLAAIREQTQALSQQEAAAKATNVQLLYGGRQDEAQHLSDMAAELNYTTLLNRQKWLGFSSVQQAMSYRQQMYNLALLENKAHFAGYLTADQYLGFLQREISSTTAQSAAIKTRAAAVMAETAAVLAYDNAVLGTHASLGQLGEGVSSAAAYASAITGLPPVVTTRMMVDDSQALASLAVYRAALSGFSGEEHLDLAASVSRLGIPGVGEARERVELSGAPETEAQLLAISEMMDALTTRVAGPHVQLEGGPEALAEAEAIDDVLTGLVWERPIEIPLAIEGADEVVPDLEAIRASLDAIPPDTHKVIYVDDVEAVQEMEDFTRAFEDIPRAAQVQAQFDDEAAETELGKFVDGVVDASRRRYEFTAGLDDEGALDDVDVLEGRIVSAEEAGRALMAFSGMGGASGGGGGGGPPPAAPGAAAPDPDDAAIWDQIMRAMRGADDEAVRSAQTSKAAGQAANTAGNAARRAGGWWGFWTQHLQLFGGAFAGVPFVSTISVWALALHTLLDFFIVLVPAVVAAGVALGSFAVAAQPAAQDVYNHFLGLHKALDALTTGDSSVSQAAQHIGFLSDQVGTLNAVMKPVPVTFRTLQDAMAPEVVTLYGAAINTLTHGTGLLGGIVQRTGAWVETFAVKLQTALSAESGVLGPLIQTALNDLHILGSIGGSILQIFTELLRAGELTHVSELLFEGLAYALSLVAKALQAVGPYALAVGIAFFAVVHYGGLLASALIWVVGQGEFLLVFLTTMLAKLPLVGGAFDALGIQMKAAFAAVPAIGILAIAAAIAAVGVAIYSAAQASSAAKAYVGGLQAALASANASQGFAQIQTNLASIDTWLATASVGQRNFVGNMAQGWADLFKDAGHGIQVYKDLWQAITGTNQQPGSTALVLKEQTAEQKDWTTTIQTSAFATRQFGTTAAQSFALMDLAGVKVTDSLAVQKTKVNDLVTGWLNMGVQGYQLKNGMNQLGAAINAVSLAGEIQDSAITTLTGDFTSFLTLVTSGETGLETFGTGIGTVSTNLKAAGASMGGVNDASFTLRQSWEAQLTAGQGLYDNLLEQNAAAGNTKQTNAELAQSGRDLVSVLLAQGGAGRESVQGTYALAQTMGYTGKATYDALEKWSGGNHNVTGTLKDLNKQVGDLETGSSNLNTDVLNLAAAVGTNLNTAIAQGLVGMPGLTKAVAGLFQYIQDNRAQVSQGVTPRELSLSDSVANALVAVYGTTPQGLDQAKNEFLATLSQMGVARQQALSLWNSSQGAFTPQMNLTPAQNRLGEFERDLAKIPAPDVNLTPLQRRLTEMQHDMGAAYNPPPGYLAQSDANQAKLVHWFAVDLPRGASIGWSAVYNGFDNDVWHPIGGFFNKDLPNWYNDSNQVLISGWRTFASWWDSNISGPWDQFWNHTVEGWASAAGAFVTGVWSNVAQGFERYVVSGTSKFFTSQLPGWLDGLGRDWNSFWSKGWTDFSRTIMQPMERWFTATLPSAMQSGLKGGIDRAVNGMNTVIGYINEVTGVVGIHIGKIPTLAGGGAVRMASGSVPGTGDEDGTHVIAMGGEYMLRKPARMALQAQYGPGFLDHLNNADAWLHSGSQGNAASQRQSGGGRYAGGGVLGDIGSWLGTAAGDVAGLAKAAWRGVGGAAAEVAKYGEQAVFNALWGAAGKPAQAGLEHLGTPGAMGAAWLQDIHNGIETWMSGKTSSAQAAAGAAGQVGGAAGTVQALARQMAAARGWTGALWNDLNAVEMDEAGWNLRAQNPTSGAYGIAQFINGPGEYAQYGGNAGTALGQVTAFLNYVQERYGSPAGALAHEEEFHWYALGGPVLNAIRQATASREEQESMALGSWLLTKWNAGDKDVRLGEYGAFQVDVRKHKGFTTADALDPVKAARLMAPYYGKGIEASTAARWKSRPDQAALYAAAIAQNAAGTRWTSPSAGTMTDAWKEVTQAFAATPEKQVSTLNKAEVAAWSKYAPQIKAEWADATWNWQHLHAWDKRPAGVPGVSARAWGQWLSERAVAERDERAAAAAMAPILAHVRNPAQIASTDWGRSSRALGSWASAMGDMPLARKSHPEFWEATVKDIASLEADLRVMQSTRRYNAGVDSAWKGATSNWGRLYAWDKRPGGTPRPSAKAWSAWLSERAAIDKDEAAAGSALSPILGNLSSPQQLLTGDWPGAENAVMKFAAALGAAGLPRQWHPEYYAGAEKGLLALDNDLRAAGTAWNAIWGEYLVPGVQVRQPGDPTVTVDLNKLITGAPFGAGGSGGGNYGFGLAGGGAVPDLTGVASMFSGGMAAGGTVPDFFIPGMSQSLTKQLQAQAAGEHPRTLSDAAGSKGGLHVGSLTINNPRPQATEESITRASNRLSFLGGRGIL